MLVTTDREAMLRLRVTTSASTNNVRSNTANGNNDHRQNSDPTSRAVTPMTNMAGSVFTNFNDP